MATKMVDAFESNSEERYVVYNDPPSLEEIASNQVAIWILCDYISSQKNVRYENISLSDCLINAFGLDDDYKDDLNKLVSCERWKIPRAIKQKLKIRLNEAIREMHSCIKHFRYELPLAQCRIENFRRNCIDRFDPKCFVWAADGTIVMKETAVKMLSVPGASEAQKFLIMCAFCMEDEMKTIALDSLPKPLLENVQFKIDPLLYYWLSRLRNELHKIPLGDYESFDERMVFTSINNVSSSAFEYFWNRLGSDKQVLWASVKLRSECTWNYQDRLLSMMSARQQQLILRFIPDSIFRNFWENQRTDSKPTLWAWNQCKDIISTETFGNLIMEMLQRWHGSEKRMAILASIWPTAGDHLKNHVLQVHADDIVTWFYCEMMVFRMRTYEPVLKWGGPSPSAIKFYVEFLSLMGSDFRRTTILENAAIVGVVIDDVDALNEIINSCHFTAGEQKQFKDSAFNSEFMIYQCLRLFNKTDFNTLNAKLKFLCASDEEMRCCKEKVLKKKYYLDNKRFVRNVNEWAKVCEYIDESFLGNSSLATSLKKDFVSSFVTHFTCYTDFEHGASMDELIAVIQSLYTTDEELSCMKRKISKAFREHMLPSLYFWKDIVEEDFLKLVRWLNGDEGVEKAIAELKNSVSIDVMFGKWAGMDVFAGMCVLLSGLRKCLKWYFPNAEDIKKFKLAKLYSLEEKLCQKFGMYLARRNLPLKMKVILTFLCDGDEDEMKIFVRAKTPRRNKK